MTELPNIVDVMSDQQKATASHLYGNTFCETPSMERLAREGVLFDNAITPHPLCMPARVAFWTSQFPHSSGSRRNETPMPMDAEHAWRIWKKHGYTTGLIGKNHCFNRLEDQALFDVWNPYPGANNRTCGMEWFRSDKDLKRVSDAVKQMPQQTPSFGYGSTDLPLEDHSTGLIAGQATRFIESNSKKPFALWVSFPDPHEPWIAPKSYTDMFPANRIELPPQRHSEFADGTAPERNVVLHDILNWRDDNIEDVYGVMGAYYAMVRFVDDGLGQILDCLEKNDIRENTIVVFCSDHGDFMGEHGMTCKGGVFYDCLTRVPLIFSWPSRIPCDIRQESMVNLIDVVPTLLELQGFEKPLRMQGDLLPVVTNSNEKKYTFSEYGCGGQAFSRSDLKKLSKPWGRQALMKSLQWREAEGRRKMIRTKDWKFVHDPMGDKDELYNLKDDPWELHNVCDCSEHTSIRSELSVRLGDWSIETEGDVPAPLPEPEKYLLS